MFWLHINRNTNITLSKQVYTQLRDKILSKELPPGEKLPSTRRWSGELKIARNILIDVYAQLEAEGYLESREGSGTYVAEGAFFSQYEADYDLSNETVEDPDNSIPTDVIDFQPVMPDFNNIPKKQWAECFRLACQDATPEVLGYGPREGLIDLRKTWSRFLLKVKGIRCSYKQIIITTGTSMSIYILSHILSEQFSHVFVEDPGMSDFYNIMKKSGLTLKPVRVDEQGMRVNQIPHKKDKSLIYVTPSHQFPLGGALPIQRRIKLLEFAQVNDTYIIENDYHFEYRYAGRPVSSLFLLDPEHVIHLGSFSGLLYPSLRLGYMIIPRRLIGHFKKELITLPINSSSLIQSALVYFIEKGYLQRHIYKMKRLYLRKRKTLIDSLRIHFGDRIKIMGDSSGQHLTVAFRSLIFDREVLREIKKNKVRIILADAMSFKRGKHLDKLVLGYGNLSFSEIEEGIRRLKKALPF
jgi:GntR family transcriptional regulator/MocR family aminotransferase